MSCYSMSVRWIQIHLLWARVGTGHCPEQNPSCVSKEEGRTNHEVALTGFAANLYGKLQSRQVKTREESSLARERLGQDLGGRA